MSFGFTFSRQPSMMIRPWAERPLSSAQLHGQLHARILRTGDEFHTGRMTFEVVRVSDSSTASPCDQVSQRAAMPQDNRSTVCVDDSSTGSAATRSCGTPGGCGDEQILGLARGGKNPAYGRTGSMNCKRHRGSAESNREPARPGWRRASTPPPLDRGHSWEDRAPPRRSHCRGPVRGGRISARLRQSSESAPPTNLTAPRCDAPRPHWLPRAPSTCTTRAPAAAIAAAWLRRCRQTD